MIPRSLLIAAPQSAANGQLLAVGEHPATETTVAAPAVVVGVGFGEVRVELGPPAATAPVG